MSEVQPNPKTAASTVFEDLIALDDIATEQGWCSRTAKNWAHGLGLRIIKHGNKNYVLREEARRRARGEGAPRRRGRPAKV
jgi:hypothetical protein